LCTAEIAEHFEPNTVLWAFHTIQPSSYGWKDKILTSIWPEIIAPSKVHIEQGNRRYQTSPGCAIPSPTSRTIIDTSNACNRKSVRVMCRYVDQSNSQLLGVLSLLGICFPQNCPFPFGIVTPRNTLFHGPSQLIILNDISIDSACIVWVPNAMLYNALSMVKKTSKLPPFPWDFLTVTEEDRATTMGHMYKKLLKIVRVRVVQEISSRTDRPIHTRSSQYFPTPVNEEINAYNSRDTRTEN